MSDIFDIVLLTLKIALTGVAVTLPIAIILAYILAKGNFAGKSLLSALIMLPLVMPPVVSGLILLETFGPNGFLGKFFAIFGLEFGFRWTGAALAAGLVALPLIVRPIRQGFEAVDSDLEEALEISGLARWRRFILLDLPIALPGILAGVILGFTKALGEFGATITFVASIPGETQTISLAIYSFLQQANASQMVLILASLSIGLSIFAVVISEYLTQKISDGLRGKGV